MRQFKLRLTLIPFFILVAAIVFLVVTPIFYPQDGHRNSSTKNSADCRRDNNTIDATCFSRFAEHTVKTKGIDAAMEALAEASRSDRNFSGACHSIAHEIGQQAYQMFAARKDIDITPRITHCTYGFYHGFMEAAAQLEGDYKTISYFCDVIDKKLRATGLDTSAECYHGIGHGAVEDHNIKDKGNAEALAQNAIALCKKAVQTSEQMVNCASGVFNGIANAYVSGEYGFSPDKNNPAKICRTQSFDVKKTCYAFMARVYLALSGGNFHDAINFAQKTTESEFMDSIISNAAVIYAGRYLNDDLTPVVSSCRSLTYASRAPCIKGMVIGLVQSSAPEKEFDSGNRLCEFSLLSHEENGVCVREMFAALKMIYPREKFMDMCNRRNTSEQALCFSIVR